MLKLNYLITRIKNKTLQNISEDYFDNNDFIYHINIALIYIFNYMNSNWTRYFSTTEETLTESTPTDIRTLEYNMGKIFQVRDVDNDIVLTHKNISINMSEDDGAYVVAWDNKIRTSWKLTNLEVVYQRMPKRYDDPNNMNVDVDLPIQAIGALDFFTLRLILPIHLENGASLANNYFEQWTKALVNYAKNVWGLHEMDDIVTADQFNDEQSQSTWGKFK